ncbi:MAG: DNA polymerase III subunit beta [Thiobacillaceae bacterium]|nr:DNA polymerase III subunit beta [Thiobacillaceae bacterium]MCX7673297.1 DNA polymerase III subunit beta [Thiobacillaceae bacterium]MDW8322589.1 DNA polymerase III subunit beta [Burkholderiales bacterium]
MLFLETRRDTLLKPLQAAVGVVDRKQTLPILSNVLITPDGARTAVVATDLELQLTSWVDEAPAAQDAITVSARKLYDICRSLPENQVLRMELEGEQLKIRSGRSRFVLQTLPAADYPRLQLPEGEGLSLSLPQSRLRHLISRVQYAMAVQDIRYYLNGMLLSVLGDRLVVAATDGHRLALDATGLDEPVEQGMDVILPRKTVLELYKLLGDGDEPLQLHLSRAQVVFRQAQFELRSKVVDGKFPDYQRVIPTGYEKSITLGRQLLQQALARTAILTNDKYRGVRLALTHDSLRLSCSNTEQEEAQEELEVAYDKEPLDISFNVQYLQDVLANLECNAVQMSFGDASSSMLMTIPGEEHFRYIVMPMRI